MKVLRSMVLGVISLGLMCNLCGCGEVENPESKKKVDPIIETPVVENPVIEDKRENLSFEEKEKNFQKSIKVGEDMDKTKVMYDLGLDLLKADIKENRNTNSIFSTMSIYEAMAMLMSGADGGTLKNMEEVLNCDSTELVNYLSIVNKKLPENTKDTKLNIANSIWLNKDKNLEINDKYYEYIDKYLGSEIRETSERAAEEEINNWVNEKTNKQIPEIINSPLINFSTVLVNSICFEGKWNEVYEEDDILGRDFKNNKGDIEANYKYMGKNEEKYFNITNARGFIKDYKGEDERYSFVGVLPNEDCDIDEFIKNLDTNELLEAIRKPKNVGDKYFYVSIPEFTINTKYDLDKEFIDMGMDRVFIEGVAELPYIIKNSGTNSLYVDSIIHKAKIEVNSKGTKASAATAIVIMENSISIEEVDEIEPIILDRPFMYFIVDNEYKTPLFMGVVKSLDGIGVKY